MRKIVRCKRPGNVEVEYVVDMQDDAPPMEATLLLQERLGGPVDFGEDAPADRHTDINVGRNTGGDLVIVDADGIV